MAGSEEFQLFQTITVVFILLFGTIGNILVVLVVIRRRKMRTVTNYFILNLAIADLTVLLSNIPIDLISKYSRRWVYGKVGCKIVKPLQTMGTTASILTLVIISLSRYHAIVYPFHHQMTIRHAKGIIVVIWIISLGSITPYSMAQIYGENTENVTECSEDFESIGMTPMMYTLTIFVLQYVFPMIGMIYAYNRIGAELNRQQYNEMGSLMDAEYKRESKKVVKMLSIVVAVFAVLVLPLHIYWIWYDCFNGTDNQEILQLVTIMLYGNSFTNPIIYSVCNDNFRTGFKELFGTCLKSKCSATKFQSKERINSHRRSNCASKTNNNIPLKNATGTQVHVIKDQESGTLRTSNSRTENISQVTAV